MRRSLLLTLMLTASLATPSSAQITQDQFEKIFLGVADHWGQQVAAAEICGGNASGERANIPLMETQCKLTSAQSAALDARFTKAISDERTYLQAHPPGCEEPYKGSRQETVDGIAKENADAIRQSCPAP